MTQVSYEIPVCSAASNPLICQLYSQQKISQKNKNTMKSYFGDYLVNKKNNKALIIGGRCGLTTELLSSFCSTITVVEEDIYYELLIERFKKCKDITYTFCTQGFIGSKERLKKPQKLQCQIIIMKITNFFQLDYKEQNYDIIILQNMLKGEQIRLIKNLFNFEHKLLLTMIIPGKIKQNELFELLSEIEQNILTKYYNNKLHQRLQLNNYITGRRQQILLKEIYIWQKKYIQNIQQNENKLKEIIQKILINKSLKTNQILHGPQLYQTQQLVNMYMNFHFQDQEILGIPNYPLICANKCIQVAHKYDIFGRALDIGCATGRTTIELADYFDEVIGIDYSKAFIVAASQQLKKNKYQNKASKIKFLVGDACKLDVSLGKFDLAFGGNLIDRLYDPQAFLTQVGQFLKPKGIMVLSSPYTWLEQYTHQSKWIGGYFEEGKPITTQQGLKKLLGSKGFTEAKVDEDVRFSIKENHWVYQYTLANMTFWRKNE